MVSFGGEQSLDRYLVLSARGLPFNVAHAAGNVAFALIAGPALVRMLTRYRTRFEFAWRKGAAPAGASLRGRGGRSGGAGTASPPDAAAGDGRGGEPPRRIQGLAAADAVAYLRAAQNEDGGFGFSPDASSSAGMTGWATLGLEAAGVDPRGLRRGGKTPLSYLRSTAGDLEDAADLERTILVVEAAGLEPRRFAGRNLVRRLLKQRDSDGSWGGQVNPTAFGVLALAAAGSGGADRSASWLVRNRNDDGGWGFAPDTQQRRRHDRGGAAGARRGREPAGARSAAASPTCARCSSPGRGLPALGRRRQRAVHGLGDPGPDRRRGLARERCARAAATRSTTSPRCRRPTATTATRAPATRPRSGSPPRPCRRPSALPSRSPRWAAPRPRARRRRARAAPAPPGAAAAGGGAGEVPLRLGGAGAVAGRGRREPGRGGPGSRGGVAGPLRDRRRRRGQRDC